jgi:calcineurin-like phosphoesterase family protein
LRRKLYFTSDWHVGHKNVLKFDQRPFKDLDEMHNILIKNFNHYVPKHGITFFLGDMGLCSRGLLKSVIDQLNGTKILVRGNHDGNINSMYNAGFDVVLDKAQITIGKNIITMTHCPLNGVFREDTTNMNGTTPGENWHKENKHKNRFSINDFGQFHLHGHIHAGPANDKKVIDGRQMDVGVPGNKYKPVSLSQIESWVNTYKDIK